MGLSQRRSDATRASDRAIATILHQAPAVDGGQRRNVLISIMNRASKDDKEKLSYDLYWVSK
jgi:hypothetical protein